MIFCIVLFRSFWLRFKSSNAFGMMESIFVHCNFSTLIIINLLASENYRDYFCAVICQQHTNSFWVILKRMFQNYLKILKTCFFGTTCIAQVSHKFFLTFQLHNSMYESTGNRLTSIRNHVQIFTCLCCWIFLLST